MSSKNDGEKIEPVKVETRQFLDLPLVVYFLLQALLAIIGVGVKLL
ncbi:MAG: hypothetical protein JSV85_05475 [Candidatus Bathyarchaeota archaeon]|nr:MAG: hypothetical protein JSV85_05475 [Candidatus Bathyarchaeota archaeon]